jgi:senataxin
LSTLHREYAALVALPYYDLSDVIFNPRLVKPIIDKREVRASMEKYGVNEPQAGAIVGAMNAEGFLLIQGCVSTAPVAYKVF